MLKVKMAPLDGSFGSNGGGISKGQFCFVSTLCACWKALYVLCHHLDISCMHMYPQALNLVDQVELGLLKQSSATQFQPTSPGREGLRGKRRASHNQPQNPSTGKLQGMFHCQRVVYPPPIVCPVVRPALPFIPLLHAVVAYRCCTLLFTGLLLQQRRGHRCRIPLSHTIAVCRCHIPLSHTIVAYRCCIPLLHTIVAYHCLLPQQRRGTAHHCSLAHCCLLPSRKLFVSTHIPCISCHCLPLVAVIIT